MTKHQFLRLLRKLTSTRPNRPATPRSTRGSGVGKQYVSRLIRLAFLAPEVVERIVGISLYRPRRFATKGRPITTWRRRARSHQHRACSRRSRQYCGRTVTIKSAARPGPPTQCIARRARGWRGGSAKDASWSRWRRRRFSRLHASAASSSRKSCMAAIASPARDGIPVGGTVTRCASGFFISPPRPAFGCKPRSGSSVHRVRWRLQAQTAARRLDVARRPASLTARSARAPIRSSAPSGAAADRRGRLGCPNKYCGADACAGTCST
jgi:hypothetical protein